MRPKYRPYVLLAYVGGFIQALLQHLLKPNLFWAVTMGIGFGLFILSPIWAMSDKKMEGCQ